MLNSPPGYLPWRHFEPQDFPYVELRRDSLATCNVQDEDAGYGLFILEDTAEGQIISWYSEDIISKDKADKLKAQRNKHIRIVKVPSHCLNSQPRPWRDYAYYAAHHQLAGFAHSSHHFDAYFVGVGDYTGRQSEVFANYNPHSCVKMFCQLMILLLAGARRPIKILCSALS